MLLHELHSCFICNFILVNRCYKYMITVGLTYVTDFKVSLLLLNVKIPFLDVMITLVPTGNAAEELKA